MMPSVTRVAEIATVRRLLRRSPIVALLGARQVGKTTLARQIAAAEGGATLFDLEDPAQVARLADPALTLAPLRGLVVLDEIQRRADLFPLLRVLADRPRRPARFLLLGSASPELVRGSSETLAGRIAFHELPGFTLDEVGAAALDPLWRRGAFPRAFLARTDVESEQWRRDFVRTYLERDLPQLGIGVPALTMRRFWTMVAHYHAQIWNSSELARAFGVSDMTVRRYLDVLAGTFVVRLLAPWAENVSKRQVKSPKVYLADTGILHTLLGITSAEHLESHPKVGASWEGFAVQIVTRHLRARIDETYFWATHAGAALDLLIVRGRRRLGFEFKRTSAPAVTKSMRIALEDLRLERLDVVHAGTETFPLAPRIRALALGRALRDLRPLR